MTRVAKPGVGRERLEAPSSSVTLRAVLRLPAVRRGAPEVLAGHDALDRPVRWVHTGEVAHIARVLKGGELLLTTGMGIPAGNRARIEFIQGLAARRLAGVVVELGSSLTEIPPAIVRAAESNRLPLIALHREVLFVEITEAVHREIVNRQFVLMRRGEELHQRFTNLMLQGAGIPEVLAALAEAIANPVVLETAEEGILYHATHHADDGAVLAAWSALRASGATVPVVEKQVPLGALGQATLVALGLDSPLDEFEHVAVERAVGLLALTLLQSRQEALLAARERGDFLAWLLDRQVDEAEAAAHASLLGFSAPAKEMLPIAVVVSPMLLGAAPTDEAQWAKLWRSLRSSLTRRGISCLAGSRGPARPMLAVLGLPHGVSRAEAADRAASLIHAAAAVEFRTDRPCVVVGVGPEVSDWNGVGAALRDAETGIRAAAHGAARAWHDLTTADLDRLLWSLRRNHALARFARCRLDRLIEHDAERGTDLVKTLRVYCAHAGRRGEAARALYIKRQTLYYRLARIEELLEVRLTDGDALLDVHLALRAQPYIGSHDQRSRELSSARESDGEGAPIRAVL